MHNIIQKSANISTVCSPIVIETDFISLLGHTKTSVASCKDRQYFENIVYYLEHQFFDNILTFSKCQHILKYHDNSLKYLDILQKYR